MTPQDTRTDAEIAAAWSIEATTAGRYELAEAALRIAIQAHRLTQAGTTAVPVPIFGATRDEQPRRPYLRAAAPLADDKASTQILPAAIAEAAEMPGIDRRCTEKILQGNVYAPCHGALYWVKPHQNEAGLQLQGYWRHLDTDLDNDHVPVYAE